MPLLEAVENAALRAGVPVDARDGDAAVRRSTRCKRLWDAESLRPDRRAGADRATSRASRPEDLLWILMHAPVGDGAAAAAERRPPGP